MQVLINGMTMAYEDHGAGPAVLLLNGFSADHPGWKSQIQRLTLEGYRVIVPELRGFGESSAPVGDCRMDALSDLVVGLLNYLGIGRAAMLGLSSGAQVLHALLQHHPHRLAAAVFVELRERKGVDTDIEYLPELAAKRSVRGGCLVHFTDGADVTRSLLDFFSGVKRFRPRCQVYGQVA